MGVGKQNLTVQLDSETVRRAEVIAAERGRSMSALVSQVIEELTAAHERYERSREAALRTMADVGQHASELDPASTPPVARPARLTKGTTP